jgi:hypothetical protein
LEDVAAENPDFAGDATVSRGLAYGDLDNDGGCDIVISDIDSRLRVFRNICQSPGRWLLVRAVDPALQRDAYGAEIYVQAEGRTWMRWINPGSSYMSSNDPRAHFGLGALEAYQSLRVVWPDGSEEVFSGGKTNRIVTVQRGDGS